MPRKKVNIKQNAKSQWLNQLTGFLKQLHPQFLLGNALFICFLFGLCVLMIYNTHCANRNRYKVVKLQNQLKELRWEYSTLKAQSVKDFRYSSLLKNVEDKGLRYTDNPLEVIYYSQNGH